MPDDASLCSHFVLWSRNGSGVDSARSALGDRYRTKPDILNNRLRVSNLGMTFKPYADEMDVVGVGHFAPYQYQQAQLAQKVFEAIRCHGVTGPYLATNAGAADRMLPEDIREVVEGKRRVVCSEKLLESQARGMPLIGMILPQINIPWPCW